MSGHGISANGLAYCLWVLSTSDSLDSCQGKSSCPVISLTIRPDIRMKCGQNYVYVFDGIPEFLMDTHLDSAIHADPNLIGAFCGNGWDQPIRVDAISGTLATSALVCEPSLQQRSVSQYLTGRALYRCDSLGMCLNDSTSWENAYMAVCHWENTLHRSVSLGKGSVS
ncbi:hypothetical protein scyTo_0021714 [Scyliorhinus torazame]|uniref:CUB domain-containing protein n=1 Tax=Scyliorhinus torazame TaxID=75743 RepID=A0A401QBH3_SCYTO|nr:hypothetical protein [Scyliorhinus torazame]